jgi:16S rRNA (guanine(966)-N(2))-methyltransferase RsmD
MRVIAGTFRGMKLIAPTNEEIRPTLDRVREDIFNIIAPYVYEADFLDLYSGSGAVAIEAISRNAMSATLVENAAQSLKVISENIKKTKQQDKFKVVARDVERFLNQSSHTYDIIFLDPPYKETNIEAQLDLIVTKGLIDPSGVIVAEQGVNAHLPESFGSFSLYRTKKYKSTVVYFYRDEHSN